MNASYPRTLYLRLIVAVCSLFTACVSSSTPLPTDITTEQQLPPSPSVTISPTKTHLPTHTPTRTTPTETATFPPSLTPTATPSSTPIPQPASLTVSGDARCRTGPGLVYDTAFYLQDGTNYEILGQVEDGSWLLIHSDDESECWISETVVTVYPGSVAILVMTPPPSPTTQASPVADNPPLYFYMIKEGLNVACGNDEVPVYTGVNRTGNLKQDVKSALNALFANPDKYVAGLFNPIYLSRMRAKGLTFDPNTGVAIFQFSGSFVKPKDDCDSARMRAQIWSTIYQFDAIKKANIWMNNVLLGDLLEGRR